MVVSADGLRSRWLELLASVGIPDEGLFDDLVARYAESQRLYHTVEHLMAVVKAVESIASDVGLVGPTLDSAQLAAWFHDAVYDPRAGAGENERRSAQLAVDELSSRGADAALVDRVGELVTATADHRGSAAVSLDAAVLFDVDLSILAAEPSEYDRCAAAVRREYAHVANDAFRTGRSQVGPARGRSGDGSDGPRTRP